MRLSPLFLREDANRGMREGVLQYTSCSLLALHCTALPDTAFSASCQQLIVPCCDSADTAIIVEMSAQSSMDSECPSFDAVLVPKTSFVSNGLFQISEDERQTAMPPDPPPGDDVDHSYKSEKTASLTSTVRHDEIPFDQLKPRIQDLCHMLWPSTEPQSFQGTSSRSIAQSLLKRILGRSGSQFIKGFRSKSKTSAIENRKSARIFRIEHMKGGSYNRVVGITIEQSSEDPTTELVLRIPRGDWQIPRPDRDAAILRCVSHHTSIPVAEIEAFDLSKDNPLKAAYIVQSRIRGKDLGAACKDLDTGQWVEAARQIGRIMRDLHGVRNPVPGLIEATMQDDKPVFSIRPFEIKSPLDMEWNEDRGNEKSWTQEKIASIYKTPFYFLVAQFAR